MLKLSKCEFFKNQIDFLGYNIPEGKIPPDNVNKEKLIFLLPFNEKEI